MQNIVAGPSYILHLYNLWLIPIITLATSHKKKDGLTFKFANPLVNLQAWNPKCNNYILACWKSDSKNYSKVRALNPKFKAETFGTCFYISGVNNPKPYLNKVN